MENIATLDQLLQHLRGLDDETETVDMSSLPTFGGEAPRNTLGIWSWDAARLLVGDGDDLKIVSREWWDNP